MKFNKLLVILILFLFLGVGALLFNTDNSPKKTHANSKQNTPSNMSKADKHKLTDAERDTVANTLKTISARSVNEEKRNIKLLAEVKALRENALKTADVTRIVNQSTKDRARDLSLSFTKKIKELRGDFDDKIKTTNLTDIPDGLGFDNLSLNNSNKNFKNNKGVNGGIISDNDTVVTIYPMTKPVLGGKGKKQPLAIDGSILIKNNASTSINTNNKGELSNKSDLIPFYTINQNATLISNTTMTALVGIVPNIQGSVLDPIRFKIISGNNNIASNGLYIPNVKNIVWSGIAIGNREMSCVRGELHSVTFTFNDGTIRTINSQADSGKSKFGGNLLGYIATPNGNPCMPGLLVTNAQDYLKDRMIASGFASAAEGFSQTQVTSQTTSSGAVSQFFDGNTADFIAANTLKGTLGELTDYLRDRQRQAVDLVFLEGGIDVVVHVEKELSIDYDPNGRKLNYENTLPTSFANYRLD